MPAIQIGQAVVSSDILDEDFVCNLSKCHGACCVAGDSGAPVTEDEAVILDEIYPQIKDLLRPEGVQAIEEQGTSAYDKTDGELVTPLIEGKECAYVIFEGKTALCGIEKAQREGRIDFQKPLSCHLYPIRIRKYPSFEAVNYDRWSICAPACTLGASLKTPVYRFAKQALIRKFGEKWYAELEKVDTLYQQEKKNAL